MSYVQNFEQYDGDPMDYNAFNCFATTKSASEPLAIQSITIDNIKEHNVLQYIPPPFRNDVDMDFVFCRHILEDDKPGEWNIYHLFSSL
jgi:hypothetical protein